ncbi:MAG: hypothetical protein HKN63_10175 [Rhodobacteraceae bacterium]|nr:hypothetical protein [Paracoccaceae bacterium]
MSLPAAAQQPYSESLVDCASLVTISNRMDPSRAEGRKGQALQDYGNRLLIGAVRQAEIEGHSDAVGHVRALVLQKNAHWDDKGMMFVFSEEFRDWMSYCRKFARHVGITPPAR